MRATADRAVRPSRSSATARGDPIERVFLEDVARRSQGRFAGARRRRGCRADGAVPPRHQPRSFRRRLRSLRGPGGEVGRAHADRRGRCRLRALGGGPEEAASAPRRPSRPTGLRDQRAAAAGRHGPSARGRRPISTCSSRRVRPPITRSSASTRCVATRMASAGGRAPRSRKGDRGSGSRMA